MRRDHLRVGIQREGRIIAIDLRSEEGLGVTLQLHERSAATLAATLGAVCAGDEDSDAEFWLRLLQFDAIDTRKPQ